MGINVLMMGGRRCGKTSALAIMFDQFVHGRANDFFTIGDQTKEETKFNPNTGESETKDSLVSKKYELWQKLEHPSSNTFLVDSGPTGCEWTYTLQINIPGSPRKKTTIEFTDCPGEYYQRGERLPIAQSLVEKSDVFVIVVDTPIMMEESSKAVRHAVNCIDYAQTLLQSIDNGNGEKAKMVIFVPIKCEKWVKENRINEVVDRIKQDYKEPIKTAMAYDRMNVCILPIETAGNILFSELTTPPLTITTNGETYKCCRVSDQWIRLADGTFYQVFQTDTLNKDIDAVIPGSDFLLRPYSWFHINQEADPNDLYQPHNCEQLPLHILSFMTKKMATEGDGFFWTLIFGGISRKEMERKMSDITTSGLIKNNIEGIEYLKRDL